MRLMPPQAALTPPFRPRNREIAHEYTLQNTFAIAGLFCGITSGIIFQEWAAAVLGAALFWATGLTWRRTEPPIVPFCLAYQWLYVAVPYFQWAVGAATQKSFMRVDPTEASLLAGLGFIALAIGIRIAWALLQGAMRQHHIDHTVWGNRTSVRRLFWTVIAVNLISWRYYIDPWEISFGFAQFIFAALILRLAFFVLLWQQILQQRWGYGYGITALAFVITPMLASKMSGFKVLFFLILVLIIWEMRPGGSAGDALRKRMMFLGAAAMAVGLVFLGILWEGAIKPVWRTADVDVADDTMSRLDQFSAIAEVAIQGLEWDAGAGRLVDRVGSIDQFARVIERVPSQLPYEGGKFTGGTIRHVLMPRIFFPDKPYLDSSRTTRMYADIDVGEETSVGIGYMAEIYIDFGPAGMLFALVVYGAVIGLLYATLLLRFPAEYAAPLLMVLFVDGFDGFESDLAKQIGGMLFKSIVFSALVFTVGRPFLRFLSGTRSRPLATSDRAR